MSTEARALELLGQGLSQEIVASAVGVSAGRISQLMADSQFAAKVQEARIKRLGLATKMDDKLDELEDKVLDKLKQSIGLMHQPGQLLKAVQILNAAKRRGAQVATPEVGASRPVQITLPNIIINKFTTNVNNQVVEVTDGSGNSQTLVTAASASLPALAKRAKERFEEARLAAQELEAIEHAETCSEGFSKSPRNKDKTIELAKGERVTVEDLL